jgi:hypothetical protein
MSVMTNRIVGGAGTAQHTGFRKTRARRARYNKQRQIDANRAKTGAKNAQPKGRTHLPHSEDHHKAVGVLNAGGRAQGRKESGLVVSS